MSWFSREGTQELFYKDELKPRPSHKLIIPKGTIFKAIGDSPDVVLDYDIRLDCLVTMTQYSQPINQFGKTNEINSEIYGTNFGVSIKN